MQLRGLALAIGLILLLGNSAVRAALDWVPYVNQRFGFSLRYPANLFEPERKSEAGDGEVFAGMRGQGRLLVGALENSDGHSIDSYMTMIRQQSYAGYHVDYAPTVRHGLCCQGRTIAMYSTKRSCSAAQVASSTALH